MKQIINILIALSQLTNTVLFFGLPDESVSAKAYRNCQKKRWGFVYSFINAVFFWQEDHCFTSYIREKQRRHLPREYSDADR